MWLNKRETVNTDINWQSEKESQSKTDLKHDFSESSNSELIEEEYKSLPKVIENLIRENFLKKEFYENLPDWTNPEIDNICKYSALDIEERKQLWKGIFYMNSCISQTLYLINKIKKYFPHLSEKINLCVEYLRLIKLQKPGVHVFIKVDMDWDEPIIIDFAHNNDVYIYRWPYKNQSTYPVLTKKILPIPINSFNWSDNIFDIAIKSHLMDKDGSAISASKGNDNIFREIRTARKSRLLTDNSVSKFEDWKKSNTEIRIHNLLKN